MSYALRMTKKRIWDESDDLSSWLLANQIHADAVTDLRTSSNTLSVFLISDDLENLERVITALSANRDAVVNFDYFLVDFSELSNIGIKYKCVPGNTIDKKVNSSWHFDLSEMTGQKVCELAKAVKNSGEKKRISSKEVLKYLVDAVKSGWIKKEDLKPRVRERI